MTALKTKTDNSCYFFKNYEFTIMNYELRKGKEICKICAGNIPS